MLPDARDPIWQGLLGLCAGHWWNRWGAPRLGAVNQSAPSVRNLRSLHAPCVRSGLAHDAPLPVEIDTTPLQAALP